MQLTAMILPLAAVDAADDTSRAVSIAIIGMLMVFLALTLLTGFLSLLPRLLGWVNAIWPEVAEAHGARVSDEEILGDDDDVLAAIAYVLHSEGRELP